MNNTYYVIRNKLHYAFLASEENTWRWSRPILFNSITDAKLYLEQVADTEFDYEELVIMRVTLTEVPIGGD